MVAGAPRPAYGWHPAVAGLAAAAYRALMVVRVVHGVEVVAVVSVTVHRRHGRGSAADVPVAVEARAVVVVPVAPLRESRAVAVSCTPQEVARRAVRAPVTRCPGKGRRCAVRALMVIGRCPCTMRCTAHVVVRRRFSRKPSSVTSRVSRCGAGSVTAELGAGVVAFTIGHALLGVVLVIAGVVTTSRDGLGSRSRRVWMSVGRAA